MIIKNKKQCIDKTKKQECCTRYNDVIQRVKSND
jgi:hypothetical protein